MPTIILHLAVADEAAKALRHPILTHNQGSYLLGASSPDIRIITEETREETHYYDLSQEEAQSGAERLFLQHPELSQKNALLEGTRAFVAGYLSHLVTDEVWIARVYRPFFGKGSPLAADPMVNVLDRALQFELDRRERLDCSLMAQFRACLETVDLTVGGPLVDGPTLLKWRDFVLAATTREPSWERFRGYAERFLLPLNKVNPKELEDFISALQVSLERVVRLITPERLDTFRQETVRASIRVVEEYLS